jgi:ribonuclease J
VEEIGSFRVEFIHVTHSIVDAVMLAITTPAGTILHTGDFKIDSSPIDGQVMDLPTIAQYGDKVLALFQTAPTLIVLIRLLRRPSSKVG